jgi:predicted acylesterase/phospholipase RssA
VDIRALVEVVYQTEFPMDFASVLASPVDYHPLATDAATGASTDLRPLIGDPAELRLALRASASLPFLAGPPVELRGRRFYDAGVAESIPYRTALAQGATHVLVLRSRVVMDGGNSRGPGAANVLPAASAVVAGPESAASPQVIAPPRPPRSIRLLARTTLRRESRELRTALLTRGVRTAADVVRLAELQASGQAFSIRPAATAPMVSRLATDGELLRAAFEAGREAVHTLFPDGVAGP